jgi:hypothetical protein
MAGCVRVSVTTVQADRLIDVFKRYVMRADYERRLDGEGISR